MLIFHHKKIGKHGPLDSELFLFRVAQPLRSCLRHHLQLSCASWMCFPSSNKSKVKVSRHNGALKIVILVVTGILGEGHTKCR